MDEKVLQIIVDELNKYEELRIEDLLKIIENKTIKKYLNNEFKSDTIKRSDLDKYKANDDVITLFEMYFDKNNIKIIEDVDDTKIDNPEFKLDVTSQYLKEMSKIHLLTSEEEKKLFIKYKNGDMSAKKLLIEANLRLVVVIARGYNNANMSFDDLIQEGSIGLITAIEKFDITKGCKLSTYATWWIKQAITRSIYNDSRIIRIPVYAFRKIAKIKRISREFYAKNGRTPTIEELSEIVSIPVEEIKSILDDSLDTDSLDRVIGEADHGEVNTPMDFVADDINIEDKVVSATITEKLTEILDTLSSRERNIIILRFGLYGNKMHTLEEIGEEFDLSRERIRQIENRTLSKMKVKASDAQLDSYLR